MWVLYKMWLAFCLAFGVIGSIIAGALGYLVGSLIRLILFPFTLLLGKAK